MEAFLKKKTAFPVKFKEFDFVVKFTPTGIVELLKSYTKQTVPKSVGALYVNGINTTCNKRTYKHIKKCLKNNREISSCGKPFETPISQIFVVRESLACTL